MASTIGGIGALAATSSAATATAISTTLQANVQSSQSANIEALFGSIGLGAKVNATA